MTSPDQYEQAQISGILKRCKTTMLFVRNPACDDLHVIAARTAIVAMLYERCWTERQIAQWLLVDVKFIERIIVDHHVDKVMERENRGRVV